MVKPSFLLAAVLSLGASQPDSAQGSDGFDPLIGTWVCDGYFVESGRRIASRLTFSRDEATGVVVVRHDDTAPNVYHALEMWTATQGAAPFRAAIASRSGMRWFASDGWREGRISWSRLEQGNLVERFTYAMQGGDRLQVDWMIAREGRSLTLGDRLNCRKP